MVEKEKTLFTLRMASGATHRVYTFEPIKVQKALAQAIKDAKTVEVKDSLIGAINLNARLIESYIVQ